MNFRTKILVSATALFAFAAGITVDLAAAHLAESAPSASSTDQITLTSSSVRPPSPKLPTRPCPEDDGTAKNCYWDAAQLGNGKGHSYIVDARGKLIYLDPKLNNPSARLKFARQKQAAGWEFWGAVWGHQLCWAKVGDTSYIHCFDGFRETS
ncbi:hypothetical protein [Streptomyces sp. NPDC054849]